MAAQLFSGNEYGRAKTNKLNQLLNLQSDKGFFSTSTLLNSAYATGEDGWYAHVGATDTIWSWTGAAWADSTVAPVVDMVNLSYDRIMANADFSVAQDGGSYTSVADGDFILDVYKYTKVGSVVHDALQSTTVPTVAQAGHKVGNSLKLTVTTAGLTTGSQYSAINGYIEGYDFKLIAQQDFTFTFWHSHTVTGTYCAAVTNSGADRTYIVEYAQSVSDAMEKATVTVTASPTAGTWDYTNGTGLKIIWSFSAVGTTTAAADTWNTTSDVVTSSQVNGTSTIGNKNIISDIRFGGSSVTSSEPNEQQKLAHVQRYFVAALTVGASGYADAASQTAAAISMITYPTAMRAAPTVTYTAGSSTNTTGALTYQGSANARGSGHALASLASGRIFWYGTIELDKRLT